MIDPRAVIDPAAQLDEGVRVGPFAVIGPDVEIGAGTTIGPHAVISGPTRIGRDNRIHAFSSIGEAPQDKKYHGEPTRLEIGDRNVIREYCTFNRGTVDGGGVTRVGNDNWIMAYVHIAHDCELGDNIVMANAASLAGHVSVADRAILGGFAIVHQFCRIGSLAFCAMGSVINRDVPPYVTVSGHMAQPHGLNREGLRRSGADTQLLLRLRRAYRTLYREGLTLPAALERLREERADCGHIANLVDFIEGSERGILR